MTQRPLLFLLVCTIATTGSLVLGCGAPADSDTLLVLAASSLGPALSEVAADFEQRHPGVEVQLSLASSLKLRRQIEQGAPADVFVSASSAHIDALDAAELLTTRRDLLTNRIVCATVRGTSSPSITWSDWIPPADRIGLGEPGVPVGDYARATLSAADQSELVEPHIVNFPHEQAVVQAVRRRAVDFGIVYASSVVDHDDMVIANIPESLQPSIVYPVATLERTEHPTLALQFLEHLESRSALDVFVAHGFRPAGSRR